MAESSHTFETGHSNENHASQFNQDNPFHLQSSDSPGMKLVSDQFDGTGFSNWKRSMMIALSARNKLGFIDGSIPKPASTSPTFKSWSRCNDMVISWILGALSKSIGRSVIYSNSAHEMWIELEERYGVSNGAQLFGLHKELAEISQGNNNIADYFTKMKMLWDDIDSLCLIPVCTCGCKCGASQKLSKFQQDQRVIQFLMGLNDTFNIMRGSILMKSPLPSIGQAYSLLLQEETQREIHAASHFMTDSASLNVNSSRFNNHGNFSSQSVGTRKSNFDTRKLHCNYCKKPGHVMEKCFKLHGFPADFKFTKSRRVAAQVEVSEQPVPSSLSGPSTNASGHFESSAEISPELCSQIMKLLKSAQTSESVMSTANFAGPFSEEATGSW